MPMPTTFPSRSTSGSPESPPMIVPSVMISFLSLASTRPIRTAGGLPCGNVMG